MEPAAENQGPPERRRRPRYPGTHPRRFEERYKELAPDRFPDMQGHVRSQGRTPAGTHVPILIHEVMSILRPQAGEVVADCTLGYGGHAQAFLERIMPGGALLGFDLDQAQLERTVARLRSGTDHPPLHFFHSNFAGLPRVLGELGLDGCDIIFADLGASSMQFDDPARGFSYKYNGPLDMRMDARIKHTAADLLARISERELADVLRELADEPDAERVASAIVAARRFGVLRTTEQLAEVVLRAKRIAGGGSPARGDQSPGRSVSAARHPAAPTFQALRMLVNRELESLTELLRIVPHCLRPGGRFGVLSFHSGEDRLIKQSLRQGLERGVYAQIADEVTRPSPLEQRENPRSRSAKLRWAVRASA